MDEQPGEAIAWYAAGCYYMACSQVRTRRNETHGMQCGVPGAAGCCWRPWPMSADAAAPVMRFS